MLAVINSLKKLDANSKVFFVGSRFGIESKLIPKMGIKYYGISTGKFRRYHKSKILNLIDPTTLFNNIGDFFRFLKGIVESRNILSHENPDVLFAKGGFVSLPVGIAARTLRIPIVIHESDLVMGLANRQMSKFANKICISFPKKNFPNIDQEKIEETGNPVREDILKGDGKVLKKQLNFSNDLKTILILGGSQGSQFINETISQILKEILFEAQILWVTGERDNAWVNLRIKELPPELKTRVAAFGFLTSEMADVYDAADLVISRSGSNVIFELAALGKPAIFIPYDVSVGGHQFQNARYFSRSGAAYVFNQQTLEPKKLLHQVKYLIENESELSKMSSKIKGFADLESPTKVAKIILQVGKEKYEQTREDKE